MLEDWKAGRFRGDERSEDWNVGRLEGWKIGGEMKDRKTGGLEHWKMEDLRRIEFLKAVKYRLEMLCVDPNKYGIVVPTVAFDDHHLTVLDERSRLPAIHIMQGTDGVIAEGPTLFGGDLGDIVETFPVLLRCTVKGPDHGEDPKKIQKKSFQAIRLRHAVEKVLVGRPGQDVLGVCGIVHTMLTTFSLPQVTENWGSPWLHIEFNYHIIHTYRKGEPV